MLPGWCHDSTRNGVRAGVMRLGELRLPHVRGVLSDLVQVVSTLTNRHFPRIGDQPGANRIGHCPANDLAAPRFQNDRKIQKAACCRHEGDVGHAQSVRPWRCKLAIHQFRRWPRPRFSPPDRPPGMQPSVPRPGSALETAQTLRPDQRDRGKHEPDQPSDGETQTTKADECDSSGRTPAKAGTASSKRVNFKCDVCRTA